MNGLAPVAGKLVPLVRMLGSPVDGEALAACRAIGCTLESAGCDLRDLAEVIEHAGLPVVVEPPRPEPEPEPTPQPWQAIAMACLHRGADGLRPAQADFLCSMATWSSEPSAKQWRWLDDIAEALGVVQEAA